MASITRPERRASPRRRIRDRIATGAAARVPAAGSDIANLLVLLEDDLRETALALGAIELYLVRATELLERPDFGRADQLALGALAGDGKVLERIDALTDNLGGLRRRMTQVAAALK
jgi:hypothetical protein